MTQLRAVRDAQQQIIATVPTLGCENVPLLQAFDRVLGRSIQAEQPSPPFTNSSMDGFAVRSRDLTGASPALPATLAVVADIPAGSVSSVILQPGQSARIMTGAPLPEGADAVVPLEQVITASSQADTLPAWIRLSAPAEPGQYVRPCGQDFAAGQTVLTAGKRLRPQDIGLLAALGHAVAPVRRRPRVGIFSSGDELTAPGQALAPGQIYDANQYFLSGLISAAGAEVIQMGTAPDRPAAIVALLDKALAQQLDLIVTSAGVSVGVYDYVRQVIEENGSLDFWRVNMRPGKPLAFGQYRGIPLIGLPGNPVSAFVGCVVFVLPAVRQFIGLPPLDRQTVRVTIADSVESDGRETYLRAQVSMVAGKPVAHLPYHQGSGNLFALVGANALLIVPSGVKSLPAASEAEAWIIGDPIT